MRLTHVLMLYFIIGAMMWGGGLIAFSEIGVAGGVVDDPGDDGIIVGNETVKDEVESASGSVSQAATAFVGGLIVAINLAVMFLLFIFWPIALVVQLNAPIEIQVLVGGGLSMAFVLGFIRFVRSSA